MNGSERDLPGPLSRDDDEDSSPLIQDLDLANHVTCSTRDMTTFGHEANAFTHSGFLMATQVVATHLKRLGTPGSNRKMTPESRESTQKIAI